MARKTRETQPDLREAERLYAEQRYPELIRHLAPQIFLFRSSARYYHLMAVASLHVGDWAGAQSYALRGIDLDPFDQDLHFTVAMSHLGRKDAPQALQVLVGIQDRHPADKRVAAALDRLREASDRTDWAEQMRTGAFRDLYPRPGFNWRPWLRRAAFGLAGAAALAVLVGLGVGAWQLVARSAPPVRPLPAPSAARPDSDDRAFGALPGAAPRFRVSSGEADRLVAEIAAAFRDYRDNKARLLANRLMQSDAPESAKAKIRGLASHFRAPGFVGFRDNPVPADVLADPVLHEGVFVLWRGRIADVARGATAITFRLLVGYESSPVVAADLPVSLGFAADLHDGDTVELVARLRNADKGLMLEGTAIRPIKGG